VCAGFLSVVCDRTQRVVTRAACPVSVLLYDAGAVRVRISAAVRGICHRGIVQFATAAAPDSRAQFDGGLMIDAEPLARDHNGVVIARTIDRDHALHDVAENKFRIAIERISEAAPAMRDGRKPRHPS